MIFCGSCLGLFCSGTLVLPQRGKTALACGPSLCLTSYLAGQPCPLGFLGRPAQNQTKSPVKLSITKEGWMKVKFIILLLLIPFFSGCATYVLTRDIRNYNSPLREFKIQNYSGTIMYDSNTDIYYTDQLLKDKGRKVAISFFRPSPDRDLRFKIEEITDFPKIPLKEAQLRILPDIDWRDADLLTNALVIENGYDKRYKDYFLFITIYKDNKKTHASDGCFNVRKIRKNFIIYNLKKLGYLITVPIDVVTSLFQFLYAITHIPE
jgi:hypothetical protein